MTQIEKQNLWRTRLDEFKGSGQSVPTWCAANDVKPSQLWYWLRKEKHVATEPTLSWLPLDLSDAGLQNSLVVRVGQVAIDVRPGFDPKLLVDVVKALMTR